MTTNDFSTCDTLKFLAIKDLIRVLLVEKKSLKHVINLCITEYNDLIDQIKPYVKIHKLEGFTCSGSLVARLHALPNAPHALSSYDMIRDVLVNIKYINELLRKLDNQASRATNYEIASNSLLELPHQYQLNVANGDAEAIALTRGEAEASMHKMGFLSFLEQLALVTDPKEQHLYLGILLIQNPELFSLVLYMQHYITSEQKFSDYYAFTQAMVSAGYANPNALFARNLDEIIERIMMQHFAFSPEIFAMGDFAGFMQQLESNPQLTNILLLKLLPFLLGGMELWNHYKSYSMVAEDNNLCHWWKFFIIAVNNNPELMLMVSNDLVRLLDLFVENSMVCIALRMCGNPAEFLQMIFHNPDILINHNVNHAVRMEMFNTVFLAR